MKTLKSIFARAVLCVLLSSFALIIFSACGGGAPTTESVSTGEAVSTEEIARLEAENARLRQEIESIASATAAITESASAIENEPEPEIPAGARVFQSGNASVKLFPDGNFIANLYHNTKITGTYSEMTDGSETAVLFIYNGETTLSGGVGEFAPTGLTTEVGGIKDGVLTLPEAWDDGHNHDMEFDEVNYPMIFEGGNNQKITLNADNSFIADFNDGVRIIGYYVMRSAAVVFVPGSPSADRNGVIVGSFLSAPFAADGDNSGDGEAHEDEHEHEDEDEEEDNADDLTLILPDIWIEAAGIEPFTLRR